MHRWLALAACLLLGCKSRPSGQPIVDVQILDRSSRAGSTVDPSLVVDRADTERIARAAIGRNGGFVFRDAGSGEVPWQLTVAVELTAEARARPDEAGVVPKDSAYRAAAVAMKLEALESRDGERPRYLAEALIGRNAPMFEAIAAVHAEAVEAAAKYIGVEVALASAPDAAVLAQIDDADAQVKSRAIRAARSRRLSAAVPALIKILDSEEADQEVIIQTIGALIDIGDPAAVGPLIDSARRRPPQYLGQIIFGVAQIGGKQAEAYLFTVSSGHQDPAIRRSAADALRELSERAVQEGEDR